MLLILLACSTAAEAPDPVLGATVYEGGWAEVECNERTDPDRWAIDVEEPGPVYFLVLRELNDGPTWLGGLSATWDANLGEYQQLDPSGVDLDCRAWVAR